MEKEKVRQYIIQENLLEKSGKVLVALSGGADSVALLHLLLSLGYSCEAAHCNFHLRGEESDRDEKFVRTLCQTSQVSLHVKHFDTQNIASQRHISIEMAARELRYDWFEELRKANGASRIAVAHHADDSIETFLLNLIRGTGIDGLCGIRPRNGYIVRPLLCLSRKEILHYLDATGQTFVTDSTNLQDEYTRNKIRLHVMPLLQTINPSAGHSILQTAKHLNDASLLYHQSIEEGKKRVWNEHGISIPALLHETAPEALLFEMLRAFGFNSAQTHDIYQALSGQSGKVFHSAQARLIKDRDYLLIDTPSAPVRPHLTMETHEYTPEFVIPRDKTVACFDASKLTKPLSLRLWQTGDSFVPFGMRGRKKVSDYLTDRKFSLAQKSRQWVLCCGEDIIWLIGERTDNRFRIDTNTRKVLVVKTDRHTP